MFYTDDLWEMSIVLVVMTVVGHVIGWDHEIALKILEFILNSIDKVKPAFLLSSMGMFPKSNRTKL